ncbi:MAG: hypothetical protein GOU99_02110 [Candidatus Altiarchaeota archaeon]|nr:hypothetical protein [Candidatus Altiarchaeota archaeon]
MATDGITVSQMVIGCLTFLVVIALFVAAVIIIIELGKKAIKNLKLIKQKRKK